MGGFGHRNEDHGIWSHHFMANRWGNSVRLYFGGSQITADGDCSHEIKRHSLLGRKVVANLDSIFKSRDATLPTKVRLVKAMVFPVVIYGCESRTVKKAERRRIDASELWCWKRLSRVPWTARRSNQSILKEISPGCSLEELMLKRKLQYCGHLMWRADSLEKLWCWEGLGAGGEGDNRGWDGWMASRTWWTCIWVNSGRWWWTGRPGVLRFMGSQRVGHDWATELNWSTLMPRYPRPLTEAETQSQHRNALSDYSAPMALVNQAYCEGFIDMLFRSYSPQSIIFHSNGYTILASQLS